MGILEDGETFLDDVFTESENVTVNYVVAPSTGPQLDTPAVSATVGIVPSEHDDDDFTITRSTQRDFIINRDLLTIVATPVEPKAGDLIEETRNGRLYRYEVREEVGDGAWRWHGAIYQAYRIHTVLIEEEAAP